jgi:hypothetical protein
MKFNPAQQSEANMETHEYLQCQQEPEYLRQMEEPELAHGEIRPQWKDGINPNQE